MQEASKTDRTRRGGTLRDAPRTAALHHRLRYCGSGRTPGGMQVAAGGAGYHVSGQKTIPAGRARRGGAARVAATDAAIRCCAYNVVAPVPEPSPRSPARRRPHRVTPGESIPKRARVKGNKVVKAAVNCKSLSSAPASLCPPVRAARCPPPRRPKKRNLYFPDWSHVVTEATGTRRGRAPRSQGGPHHHFHPLL